MSKVLRIRPNTGNANEKATIAASSIGLASVPGRAKDTHAWHGGFIAQLDERCYSRGRTDRNRAGVGALVGRPVYGREVLRLARNLMKRPEDARDVYQEAFEGLPQPASSR